MSLQIVLIQKINRRSKMRGKRCDAAGLHGTDGRERTTDDRIDRAEFDQRMRYEVILDDVMTTMKLLRTNTAHVVTFAKIPRSIQEGGYELDDGVRLKPEALRL